MYPDIDEFTFPFRILFRGIRTFGLFHHDTSYTLVLLLLLEYTWRWAVSLRNIPFFLPPWCYATPMMLRSVGVWCNSTHRSFESRYPDVFRYDSDAFWRQSLALYAKSVTSLTHLHRIVRKGLTDRKLAKRVICKSAAYTASVVVSCWPARAYTAKMAAPRKQGRKSWYFSGSPCAASRSYAHERTRLVSFRILSWRNSPGAPSWWRKVDGMSDFDFTLVQQQFSFSDRILLS